MDEKILKELESINSKLGSIKKLIEDASLDQVFGQLQIIISRLGDLKKHLS